MRRGYVVWRGHHQEIEIITKNNIFTMNFTINSGTLYSQLQTVSRVLLAKNTMSILNDFLFEIHDNTLQIKASDSETTMTAKLPLDVCSGDVRVTIEAAWLLNLLKEFSDQPLTFEIDTDNFRIQMSSPNGEYQLVGHNGDEYPEMRQMDESETNTFLINSQTLLSCINRTLFSTGNDDIRPVMNGIYFDLDTDKGTVVATDAHKLVRLVCTSFHADAPVSFILAKKPANILRNILGRENGDVLVTFDKKNILFTTDSLTLVCRQIEGRYPNYNAVIPQNNDRNVVVDRQTLMSAIRRVGVSANKASNLIKLTISTNQVELAAQDIEFSISARETIPCQYEGEPIQIGFKWTFLLEILSVMECEEVMICLADHARPGLILPLQNAENEDLTMLLMPMMLND